MTSHDPDKLCPHTDFTANVDITPIVADDRSAPHTFMADITASRATCGEKMRWTGLRAGASFQHPMVSPDETQLRAPMRPASNDPDLGVGLPGFAINVQAAPGDRPPRMTTRHARRTRRPKTKPPHHKE